MQRPILVSPLVSFGYYLLPTRCLVLPVNALFFCLNLSRHSYGVVCGVEFLWWKSNANPVFFSALKDLSKVLQVSFVSVS